MTESAAMTEGAAMTAFTRHARYSHVMPDLIGHLGCLSIRRAVLMEKQWVLVGLSMEEGCFVEKREIANRAGNDGERPGMTEFRKAY